MEDDAMHFFVGNIPHSFRSADLRCHFSSYVEGKYFKCFHYRHRPEEYNSSQEEHPSLLFQEPPSAGSLTAEAKRTRKLTYCCVVAVKSHIGRTFMEKFSGNNWSRSDGGLLPGKVRISKLNIASEDSKNGTSSSSIPWAELASLPELNPPSVMPQGNVGTPLSTFMSLIRACKLPSHVIRKLRLEFPKSRSSKRYGAVSFKYGPEYHCSTIAEHPKGKKKADRLMEARDDTILVNTDGTESSRNDRHGDRAVEEKEAVYGGSGPKACDEKSDDDDLDDKEDDIPSDDDHDAEEWERYEAYFDDADKQGRCNERLFEEEMEVVWEKGSSGLVFYTDASYWDQEEGDFDERCSKEDHWDVDMSVYYDPEGGGRDGREMRAMERERRLRAGEDTTGWEIGGFEKHTKGIGSKVLSRSGWVAGQGVGAANQGISEPLSSEGQVPSVKRGLGYRGEKLDRRQGSSKKQKIMKDVIISTIYDKPEEIPSTILRSAPPTTIKHRTVTFQEGGLLHQGSSNSEVKEEDKERTM